MEIVGRGFPDRDVEKEPADDVCGSCVQSASLGHALGAAYGSSTTRQACTNITDLFNSEIRREREPCRSLSKL